MPPALRGRTLEIEFGATFYKARVFVNGSLAGEHEGGHTAWRVDVTKALGSGGLVAVELDNRPGLATIPGWAMRLKGERLGLVRLVALRRDRARRGARRAGARRHPPAGDPAEGGGRSGHGERARVPRPVRAGQPPDARRAGARSVGSCRRARWPSGRGHGGIGDRAARVDDPRAEAVALRPAEPVPARGRGEGRVRRGPRPARGGVRHPHGRDPGARAVAERRARPAHRHDAPRGVDAGGPRRDARDDPVRLERHEGAERRADAPGALPAAPGRARLRRPQRRPARAGDPDLAVQRGAAEGPEPARPREADDAGDDRAGGQPPERLRLERVQRERDEHRGRARVREGDGRAREGARPEPLRQLRGRRTRPC